jgi:hypothetical protein
MNPQDRFLGFVYPGRNMLQSVVAALVKVINGVIAWVVWKAV